MPAGLALRRNAGMSFVPHDRCRHDDAAETSAQRRVASRLARWSRPALGLLLPVGARAVLGNRRAHRLVERPPGAAAVA